MSAVLFRAWRDDICLEVFLDPCPEDPREWDNLGTMVCFHPRYKLGDPHNYSTPKEFLFQLLSGLFPEEDEESFREKFQDKPISDLYKTVRNSGKIVILPVYLLDHSGLFVSTRPFSCPWDSGQVGWIYVTADKAREELGAAGADPKYVKHLLKDEVETYNDYLTGNVYGYRIVKKTVCSCCGAEKEDVLEACWGIYAGGADIIQDLKCFVPREYQYFLKEGCCDDR